MFSVYSATSRQLRDTETLIKLTARAKKALCDAERIYRVEGDEDSFNAVISLRKIHGELILIQRNRILMGKTRKIFYIQDFKQLSLNFEKHQENVNVSP